jgi:hypothetical protein
MASVAFDIAIYIQNKTNPISALVAQGWLKTKESFESGRIQMIPLYLPSRPFI